MSFLNSFQKNESHLTNFIVYDLETHNTDRARPYVFCFHRLSNLAGKYNRDLTPYEREKCEKDSLVLVGDNCVTNALDFCLKLKRDETRDEKNKILNTILMLKTVTVLILG